MIQGQCRRRRIREVYPWGFGMSELKLRLPL
jgi:hypothetical protein